MYTQFNDIGTWSENIKQLEEDIKKLLTIISNKQPLMEFETRYTQSHAFIGWFQHINKLQKDITYFYQDNRWIRHSLTRLRVCTNDLNFVARRSIDTMKYASLCENDLAIQEAKNVAKCAEDICDLTCQGYKMLRTTEPFTEEMFSQVYEKAKEVEELITMASTYERKMMTILTSTPPTQ